MKYSVKAAALATGITESRLRTWERRYGVPKPSRSDSNRRRYTEEDLAVIRRMASLVAAGLPASDAASAALLEGPALPDLSPASEHPASARIVEAAAGYDETAIIEAMRESVRELGWGGALDTVVFPALRRVGERWGEGSLISANEHFVSELVRREISAALAAIFLPPTGPLVLLACPEDERHEIGLLALSLLLRAQGLRVLYLGADVPIADVLRVAHDAGPDAICLSATAASGMAALAHAARSIISSKGHTRLFVGGPAVQRARSVTVPGAILPESLSSATKVITQQVSNRMEA